jgi:hypothetical protein
MDGFNAAGSRQIWFVYQNITWWDAECGYRAVILNKALLIYYNMVIFAGECAFLICYVIHRPEMARRMDKLA